MIDASRWIRVLNTCGVRVTVATQWAPLFEKYVQPDKFSQGGRELPDFLGQILHESARLTALVENMNYSADAIRRVGAQSVVGGRWSQAAAKATAFANNPAALANFVYGGRMGNTALGDGFKYIGRGLIMSTGRFNAQRLQAATGFPILAQPEIQSEPKMAIQIAVKWWEANVPDGALGDPERVTKAVQGGSLGLAERAELTAKARAAIAQFGGTAV